MTLSEEIVGEEAVLLGKRESAPAVEVAEEAPASSATQPLAPHSGDGGEDLADLLGEPEEGGDLEGRGPALPPHTLDEFLAPGTAH